MFRLICRVSRCAIQGTLALESAQTRVWRIFGYYTRGQNISLTHIERRRYHEQMGA